MDTENGSGLPKRMIDCLPMQFLTRSSNRPPVSRDASVVWNAVFLGRMGLGNLLHDTRPSESSTDNEPSTPHIDPASPNVLQLDLESLSFANLPPEIERAVNGKPLGAKVLFSGDVWALRCTGSILRNEIDPDNNNPATARVGDGFEFIVTYTPEFPFPLYYFSSGGVPLPGQEPPPWGSDPFWSRIYGS